MHTLTLEHLCAYRLLNLLFGAFQTTINYASEAHLYQEICKVARNIYIYIYNHIKVFIYMNTIYIYTYIYIYMHITMNPASAH